VRLFGPFGPKQMITRPDSLASFCRGGRLQVKEHLPRWIWLWFLAVVFVWTTVAAGAAEPKRILLLNSFGREFSPWNEYARQLRVELSRQVSGPIDIFETSLATARFAGRNLDKPFAEYLHSLFENHKLDLAITIGGPAAPFFHRYHAQISPATPAIFAGLEQRRVPSPLASNETAVMSTIDFADAIENILRVLPKTNNIVIVIGNSPIEKFWLRPIREAVEPFSNRVSFTWFNELSFQDMLARSATLPPRSAIFFVVLSVDAAGVTREADDTIERLHAVANAPIFSWNDIYLGRGIVGGPLTPGLEVGRTAASVAARILNGETPSNISIEAIRFGTPRFDWREMQRWGISEANLPPGSVIEFRVPTIIERYKWYIVTAIMLFFIQVAAIIALLVNRRRLERERVERERAERAAREFSARLISAQEDERSRLARELHDDITQRLAALAIAAGRAQAHGNDYEVEPTMRELRKGLVKLSEDVHALSYRLHPSIIDDLGLIEALRAECERFSRFESIPVDVKIEDNVAAPPPEIALSLFRIAQEALQNAGRHARASRVEVSLQNADGGLRICIRDNGVGFEPRNRRQASLGLASMQQRIYRLGGELDIDSTPGHGTVVLAWVPAREELHESPARAIG
jgi:signal transduction histidine kinase